jgi:hypothetical protein
MRIVKIKANDLKDAEKLLRKVGAVEENQAFPDCVYLSKEDTATLRKNLMVQAKKQYPYLKKDKIEGIVAMELLNLGPNESLAKVLKKGYAVVDTSRFEAESKG